MVLLISTEHDGTPIHDDDVKSLAPILAACTSACKLLQESKRQERARTAFSWGAYIGGRRAHVRREPGVAHQLVKLSAADVVAGRLSPKLMQKLTSSWTHHLMFARSAPCIFREVYHFGLVPRPLHAARWLPPAAAGELLGMVSLAPFYFADWRAPMLREVFVSDATETIAAVRSSTPEDTILAWLWSRIPRRGS